MMIRLALLLALICAAPAWAAPPAGGSGEGGNSRTISGIVMPNDVERRSAEIAEEFEEPDGAYVNLPMVAAPVVDGSGRMTAYVFLRPRLLLAAEGDVAFVNARAHRLLDAYTRAVHADPPSEGGEEGFDQAAAQRLILDISREMVGRERVRGLDLLGGDMRRLRR